jgi:DNA-binding MarR family transcriptional regulator
MTEAVPLPALLSRLLVAFTIEFDNEFENRMPHWTTKAGRRSGPKGAPWLVSQVMWANVMQYLDGDVPVAELHARARTERDSLKGLARWNYLVVDPDQIVRPTPAGEQARAAWRPLAAEVEGRWRRRFGPEVLDELRRSLTAVRERFAVALPQYLPMVYPTQNGTVEVPPPGEGGGDRSAGTRPESPQPDLSVLLSQVLQHFAVDYERQARVSLTIAANTLRVLDEVGVPIRRLPMLTGVSKEGNSMALGFLARRECVVLEADPSAQRGQRARLTSKGKRSQGKYHRLLQQTEAQWNERFGADKVAALRLALQRPSESLLFEGLTPYADGWRASVVAPETLPHFPMVLHRGGYPDGS